MKRYIVFFPVLIVLLSASCSEEVFNSQKDYKDHYKSGSDIRSSVVGLYAGMQKVQERLVVLNEVRGDLLNTTINAPLELKALEALEYDRENSWLSPTPFYNIIVNCNDILANIHDVKVRDAAFSEDDYHTYYAEVLTIRAWCYYQLYTLYDEVPYHESPVLEFGELHADDVVLLDTLDAQLDSAITMFYSIEIESNFVPVRVNKYTALTLSGEVNLARGNYPKAYSSLIQVCVDERFDMGGAYKDGNWVTLFGSDESNAGNEVITWLDFNIVYNQQHNLQRYFSAGQGGDYWFKPASNAIQAWENQIDDKGKLGDIYRGKGVTYKTTDSKIMVNKYSIDREYFANDVNLILYRASTAALLLAEAANRKGSPGIAAMLINDGLGSADNGVRSRVSLDKQGEGVNDPFEMEEVITNELALELAYEGRRFSDLVRLSERREDRTWLANKIAAKFSDPDMQTQMKEKIMNAESLKIPFMW